LTIRRASTEFPEWGTSGGPATRTYRRSINKKTRDLQGSLRAA